MKILSLLLIICLTFSCKDLGNSVKIEHNDSDLSAISVKDSIEFKVLDSKFLSNKIIWAKLSSELSNFNKKDYERLKPLIIDQDILQLQKAIDDNLLSYENLTKFYLFRIRQFDRENAKSLNSVIAINPNVVAEARKRDAERKTKKNHPIYGMPIFLKDNINAKGMPTTAGAIALQNNNTGDAFIVEKLKNKGALILGKTNLSEWAYFFCGDCPSGYSAVGGQTLNPYGRKVIDTGGSSSGSGVAVAANFSVGAVGSETAGSILSPASQNSTVGLKPTIGLLSRSGIVPISSTLDTPGAITRNVLDNSILHDAMLGYDKNDFKSKNLKWTADYYLNINKEARDLKGKRFGAYSSLLEDSLYVRALDVLKLNGATIVNIEAQDIKLPEFLRLLNLDMKKDLPRYFSQYGNSAISLKSVQDVLDYNRKDSVLRAPYGQKLFTGIVNDHATKEEFEAIKNTLKVNGQQFFEESMSKNNLDGVLSINNYHAAYAAVAEYPALTVPMGYKANGAPEGLTFIGKPLSEKLLLQWAFIYEKASNMRRSPENYN